MPPTSPHASGSLLPHDLRPFFASFFLTGGLLAFPGAVLDHLLADFAWSPSTFGIALFVQGVAAFFGTRVFSKATARVELHSLEAWGLLLPVVGIVVVYLLDASPLWPRDAWGPLPTAVRLLGYAFLGAGIGGSGIVNNAYALRQDDAPRALNILNMAFTAGAVTLPTASTALLATLGSTRGELAGISAWRLPVSAFLVLFLALSAWCRAEGHRSASEGRTATAPTRTGTFAPNVPTGAGEGWGDAGMRPLLCGCILLFCYVGTEINLSNSWVAFVHGALGVDPASARLASPVYWAGLFASRLFFAWRSPRARLLSRYLTVFGVAVFACVAGALGLTLAAGASPSVDGAVGAVGATTALTLAFLSGAFIGSSYSFTLGMLTHFYPGHRASRAAFATAQCGVAGSILLPPALGAALDRGGPQGGFFFVLATMGVFCAAAVTLLATRKPAPLHSWETPSDRKA